MSKKSALSTLDRDDLGPVTDATRSKAGELWDVADAAGFTLTRLWGMAPGGTEHPSGRALDFMITGKGLGKKAGDFIADYLWANRKRLAVKWIIWDEHIRSTSPGKSGEWEDYNGESPHTDHVHAFFGTADYIPPKQTIPPAPFKVGQRVRVDVDTRLHARSGPGISDKTATGRYVDPGYNIDIEKAEYADGMWWFRGDNYWYGAGPDGTYLKLVPTPKPDPAPFKKGDRVAVDVNAGATLNGRIKPDGEIRHSYQRGEELVVTDCKKVGARWWAKGATLWWAADYLRKA